MRSQLYIKYSYETASDAIRLIPFYNAVRSDFDSMQLEKYDHIYLFGSDRQQIINELVSSDF